MAVTRHPRLVGFIRRVAFAAACVACLAAGTATTTACDSTGPCCKVCRSGCPCGDSCISCSEQCHKGSIACGLAIQTAERLLCAQHSDVERSQAGRSSPYAAGHASGAAGGPAGAEARFSWAATRSRLGG